MYAAATSGGIEAREPGLGGDVGGAGLDRVGGLEEPGAVDGQPAWPPGPSRSMSASDRCSPAAGSPRRSRSSARGARRRPVPADSVQMVATISSHGTRRARAVRLIASPKRVPDGRGRSAALPSCVRCPSRRSPHRSPAAASGRCSRKPCHSERLTSVRATMPTDWLTSPKDTRTMALHGVRRVVRRPAAGDLDGHPARRVRFSARGVVQGGLADVDGQWLVRIHRGSIGLLQRRR